MPDQTPLEYMRSLVRIDLQDPWGPDAKWTDQDIDRAIQRAVEEYSFYLPIQDRTEVPTVAGQDWIDASIFQSAIRIYRIEFPINRRPRRFQPFRVFAGRIYLTGDDTGNGQNCAVEWGRPHTITHTYNSVPVQHYNIIALGAAALCVLSESQSKGYWQAAPDEDQSQIYIDWGNLMVKQFRAELRRLTRQVRNQRVISGEIYYKEGA